MLFRILALVFAIVVSFSQANAQDAAVARLIPQFDGLSRAETLRVIKYADDSIVRSLNAIVRGSSPKDADVLAKRREGYTNRAIFAYRALTLLLEKKDLPKMAALYRARTEFFTDFQRGKIDESELDKRKRENDDARIETLRLEVNALEKNAPPTTGRLEVLIDSGKVLAQNILLAATNEFGPLPRAGQDTQAKTALIGYGRISRSDNLNVFFLLGAFPDAEQCESAKKAFADDFLAVAKAAKLTAKVETSACEPRVPAGSEYEALHGGAPAKHYVLFTDNMTLMFAHEHGSLDEERATCEKVLGTVRTGKPNANCYRPSSAVAQPAPAPAMTQPAAPHESIAKAASLLASKDLSRSEKLRGITGAEKEVRADLDPTINGITFLTDNERDITAYYKRASFCYRALTLIAKDFPDIAALYQARARLYDDALAKKVNATQREKSEKENDAARARTATAELAALDKKAPPNENTLRSLERMSKVLGQIVLAAVHAEQGDVPYVHTFNQGMIALSKDDYPKVAQLLRPLAERGDQRSQFWIGYMHLEGLSLPRDFSEALKWLQRSAEQGEDGAQYQLARIYAEGKGVPRDLVSAYTWLSVAASRGHEKSAKARDDVGAHLTPAQIALAKKRASEWKPVKR